jgi:hypothetical protein
MASQKIRAVNAYISNGVLFVGNGGGSIPNTLYYYMCFPDASNPGRRREGNRRGVRRVKLRNKGRLYEWSQERRESVGSDSKLTG